MLEKWIDESNDQGRELEPPELAAAKGCHESRQRSEHRRKPKAKAEKGKKAAKAAN